MTRLAVSKDSYGGTSGALLQSRSGEIGATWTKQAISGADADAVLVSGGALRKSGSSYGAFYTSSAVPTSANYTVSADVQLLTSVAQDQAGVLGRVDTAVANGMYYVARYEQGLGAFALAKSVNGVWTTLGTYPAALNANALYRISLDMNGSSIRLLVDGVQRIAVTDASITAAGRAGVALGFGYTTGQVTTTLSDTTGMNLRNFDAMPLLFDSKGTNSGSYLYGPTLGATAPLTSDTNTAVTFDGLNDYGTVARQISDDFSIEFWMKSTGGTGAGANWWEGAALVDADTAGIGGQDFGMSLRANGQIVAGAGNGAGADLSITSPQSYNDGTWHHVVFTRVMASNTMVLYVDGGAVVTSSFASGSVSLAGSPVITLGKRASGGYQFAGSLDEVALYSAALPAATVSAHWNAR